MSETVPVLEYSSKDFCEVTSTWEIKDKPNSKFDDMLRNGWDEAMKRGVFRYNLDEVETRILEGPKQYVAQLNTKRATDRRPPQNILSLNQPFNHDSFNFTKIKDNEILFTLHHTAEDTDDKANQNGVTTQERHIIIINISPIEYGHVLVVPQVDSCLPQVLTEKGIQMGLESVLLSTRRGFRLGFNSLCAYASVNHLHFHAYYLEHELVVEHGPVEHISDILYQSQVMPVPGFVFQTHGTDLSKLVRIVHKITQYFQNNEIAHSVLMTRGVVFGEEKTSLKKTVRLYVWPRQKFKGIKSSVDLHVAVIELGGHLPIKGMMPEAFNVAVIEMGGHLPIKVDESFRTITEKEANEIISTAKLPDEEFNKIKDHVTKIVFEDSKPSIEK